MADEATPIADTEVLYRRLTLMQVQAGNPTSFGFKPRGGEGDEISFFAGPQDEALDGFDGFGLASITAAEAIAAGARLERDSKDPKHVRAFLPDGKEQDRVARKLSRSSKMLVQPTK